jgi:hypothetical protein
MDRYSFNEGRLPLKYKGKISHRKVGGEPNAIPLYQGSRIERKTPHEY